MQIGLGRVHLSSSHQLVPAENPKSIVLDKATSPGVARFLEVLNAWDSEPRPLRLLDVFRSILRGGIPRFES